MTRNAKANKPTVDKEKVIHSIDKHYDIAEYAITKIGLLLEHLTSKITFTLSSIINISVVITSAIPEGIAVAQASGSAWLGFGTACTSVGGVYVAVQKSKALAETHTPEVDNDIIVKTWQSRYWIIYFVQLIVSMSIIKLDSGGSLVLYPLVSCFGALFAAEGTSLIESKAKDEKAETRADKEADLSAQIKLMQAQSRIENNRLRAQSLYAPENGSTKEDQGNTTNSHRNTPQTIIDDKGRQKSQRKRSKKAQARLESIHQFILEEYKDQPVAKIKATEIRRKMGLTVSESTVRNDFAELRKTRLNGKVKAADNQ